MAGRGRDPVYADLHPLAPLAGEQEPWVLSEEEEGDR